MQSCGATKIQDLAYRGSYALIGIKGAKALAEETFPDGTWSVAAARYSRWAAFRGPAHSVSRLRGDGLLQRHGEKLLEDPQKAAGGLWCQERRRQRGLPSGWRRWAFEHRLPRGLDPVRASFLKAFHVEEALAVSTGRGLNVATLTQVPSHQKSSYIQV